MDISTKTTVTKLKDLIDKNGPSYMTDEPYRVYKELLESSAADRETAGALLHALVNGVHYKAERKCDIPELSQMIKSECSLNKTMADRIAEIFYYLYTADNKGSCKRKDKEGLIQFRDEEFCFKWKGYAVWDEGNGTVDCRYEADIVLMPTKTIVEDKMLKRLLDKNPFTSQEEIRAYFEKELKEYLDGEFEEYCTEDDYYQPVVEDFEIGYYVTKWSKKNGFKVVSCEGNGEDSGYEPKFRRGRY